MMSEQDDRWQRVAAAVRARMKELGIVDQKSLMKLAGISQPTAQQYMTGVGRSDTPRARQVHQMGVALKWDDDWWTDASEGRKPSPLLDQGSDDIRQRLDGIESNLRELIAGQAELTVALRSAIPEPQPPKPQRRGSANPKQPRPA